MNDHWLKERYKEIDDIALTVEMVFASKEEQKFIGAEITRREQENEQG